MVCVAPITTVSFELSFGIVRICLVAEANDPSHHCGNEQRWRDGGEAPGIGNMEGWYISVLRVSYQYIIGNIWLAFR